MRPHSWASVALAGALLTHQAKAVEFPEPIDHLAVLKDLLGMPKPKSCDPAKADLTTLQLEICSAHAFRDADAALNRVYGAAV